MVSLLVTLGFVAAGIGVTTLSYLQWGDVVGQWVGVGCGGVFLLRMAWIQAQIETKGEGRFASVFFKKLMILVAIGLLAIGVVLILAR